MAFSPIPVILDTDIGSDVDDTWALAMLLGCPELDPKLVVTANGDTTYDTCGMVVLDGERYQKVYHCTNSRWRQSVCT
jgi:inosine-uridine nucleoside N-ribohydrolase